MKLNPESLDTYARKMWEKAWRFTNRLLEESEITQPELVNEGIANERDGFHSICFRLHPAGQDGRRNLQIIYVDSYTNPLDPSLNHPEYAIITNVQIWDSKEHDLESFVQ